MQIRISRSDPAAMRGSGKEELPDDAVEQELCFKVPT